ncbi:MAG: 50S ribosomal protein L11 methyltransferase [Deltaproteobacteria bacterium]|nr:50S ribosomal protein L11 methyltransferase [Deltaproteobacteria bacterium]
MNWVELILPAGNLADEVAALLASSDDVAAAGVQVREDEIIIWAPASEAEAAAIALRAAATRLREAGFSVDPEQVRVAPAPPEDEWTDAWKRYFRVARVTKRLVIVPSWETYMPATGDVVLDLDPGRAFGTGAHASTRLCLALLERLCEEDELMVRRFIDVGTGSGILSVAAAKLWPRASGVAIDIDPQAASVAMENFEKNGVAPRIHVGDEPVATVPGTFDAVMANIQADVLEALLPELVSRVAAGGALVLSGLLAEQASTVAQLYLEAGLTLSQVLTLPSDPEWSAVLFRRPGPM